MDFQGMSALITGCATGIGRSLAIALAQRGADLALVDVDTERAKETAEGVAAAGQRARIYAADVSDRASVEHAVNAAFEDLGPIGLACANAGVCPVAPVTEMSQQDIDWVMGVNLFGVLHTVRAYVAALRNAGASRGHLMLTGSENSVSIPHALRRVGLGPYAMTKHAVLGLADALRYELAPEGIGVSILMPGPVESLIGESGRNRPERLGGPVGPANLDPSLMTPDEPMPAHIPADAAARIALTGLAAERFMIPTHSHLYDYAAARLEELGQATRVSKLEHGS